jgi:hypothetical protein
MPCLGTYGYLDLERIRADAGSQFTSEEFSTYCREVGIQLVLAAPKKQHQKHLAECTWRTISSMGRSLLVHARLPHITMYHALVYACHIFNVLPVCGPLNEEEIPAMPYQLFFDKCPMILKYRVFSCPTIACHWVTLNKTNGKQTEWGTRGIFIGFNLNQKGYVIFSPGSHQIIISDEVIFDEGFSSAIAMAWQQHKDSLALQPLTSHIPDITPPLNTQVQLRIYTQLPSKRGPITMTKTLPPYVPTSMRTLTNMIMKTMPTFMPLQSPWMKQKHPWYLSQVLPCGVPAASGNPTPNMPI